MKKTVGRVLVDLSLCSTGKRQELHVDVMHVDGRKFLISVSDPLNLTMKMGVERESREVMGLTLQGHLSVLCIRGVMLSIVYGDPHGTFKSMTQDYSGIEIDICGKGRRQDRDI
jgi:hypothetical protein